MIRTYDFALMARKNSKLMKEIKCALISSENDIIYTDIHKLSFYSHKKILRVEPIADNNSLYHKIIPKDIKYSAVLKMLANDWDLICGDEIMDVD